MPDDFEEYCLRTMDRYNAVRRAKRYGLVSSWDPKTHMSKVRLQPEDTESGWLPVHTMAAGNGYGHMTGLTPGDHVEVTFQEGEFDGGAVTARVHSTPDAPPQVQSGEQLFRTPFGQFFKMDKNGAITATDKGGATVFWDGSGNITITCKA